MLEFFSKLFDASGFMPRRSCGIWTPGEILLHNISDAIIWLAYMAIPVVLIYFVRKKRGQVPFSNVFWMFGAFIILCGMTHFVDIMMFYHPIYRFAGALKAVTAVVSLVTAITLVPLVPKALAMRTSEELEREIAERKQAQTELVKMQKQLIDTARQAGMAEVATSVLHNVGNVLNSVNVSATMVVDNLRKSKLASLSKAMGMMDERASDLGEFLTNDPKGKKLPPFLKQLSEHLAKEQEEAIKELESLRKNIDHIKDIVATQQSYAKVSGAEEALALADLVQDALSMNADGLKNHNIQVGQHFEVKPTVTVDKHKVLQILVNLIGNAKHACVDSGLAEKKLTVRISQNQDRVTVTVADNGIGIPAENLTRIFNYGFSTRKAGHGFGLHSSALSAKQMGGELKVTSDGPGKGAAFTLELPLKSADSVTAAKASAAHPETTGLIGLAPGQFAAPQA